MKTLISDMNPATRYLYLEIADSPARTKRIYYALKNLRAQGVTRVRKRLADAVQSEIDSLLEDKIRLDHINRLVTDDMLAKGGPTGTSSYNVYQMASRFINDYGNAEPPLMPVRTLILITLITYERSI
jgi:hypothetical protein